MRLRGWLSLFCSVSVSPSRVLQAQWEAGIYGSLGLIVVLMVLQTYTSCKLRGHGSSAAALLFMFFFELRVFRHAESMFNCARAMIDL